MLCLIEFKNSFNDKMPLYIDKSNIKITNSCSTAKNCLFMSWCVCLCVCVNCIHIYVKVTNSIFKVVRLK